MKKTKPFATPIHFAQIFLIISSALIAFPHATAEIVLQNCFNIEPKQFSSEISWCLAITQKK